MENRPAFSWRVAVWCLIIGLVLSIASLPVAAIASQLGKAHGPQSTTTLNFYRADDGTAYQISERFWTDPSQSRLHQPSLMRFQQSEAVPQPGVFTGPGPSLMVTNPRFSIYDPRLPRLRSSPASGYDMVEGYSAGWPMHVAYSIAHLQAPPGTGRREHGLLRLGIRGHWGAALVFPALPIWTGLIGNTLIYGGALALAWWLLIGRRKLQRISRDQCGACGYTLDAGMSRCPECGQFRPASTL